MTGRHTGRCECGAVRYEVSGPLPDAILCHCGQCRRQGGHAQAWVTVPDDRVAIEDRDGALAWYATSRTGERGFCRRCGSSLFGRFAGEPSLYVTAGSLDAPTGTTIGRHIFVGSKGDYYQITDGLPVHDTMPSD